MFLRTAGDNKGYQSLRKRLITDCKFTKNSDNEDVLLWKDFPLFKLLMKEDCDIDIFLLMFNEQIIQYRQAAARQQYKP